MSKGKLVKAERVHHNIITTVRTKKRTYNVTISKTGIRVAHVRKKDKRKNTADWSHTWEEIDAMFDKHYKEDKDDRQDR